MDADLRLRPPRPAPDLTSDPDLLALITAEIRRSGPMTFARFMELALYAPELGYYTSPATRIGRGGDFLTAPETHPIFGAAIARQVAAVWHRLGEPATFVVREYGAGTGALAEGIVAALRADEPDLATILRYEAVEINATRRHELEQRQPASPPPNASAANYAAEGIVAMSPQEGAVAPPMAAGLVLANEFFDAFPVHRVEQTPDGLRERFVTEGASGLAITLGAPSTPRLAERLATEDVELAPGQRAEIAFGLEEWFAEVGAWLGSGLVVVIDYGDQAAELYGPRRRNGTLLGYIGQQVIDDPLAAVGRQDLTAHVDFTAVERAATAAGFMALRFTTQAQYLVSLGLEHLLERARSDPDQSLGRYLELRSGLARLLDPRHTGGFRVLALGRGLGTDLPLLGA
jgi:SAM-dependent MidA family methyltransferase